VEAEREEEAEKDKRIQHQKLGLDRFIYRGGKTDP